MFVRTLFTATTLALAAPALAAPLTATQFTHKAAMTDVFELESSKLALTKSSDGKVKDFANMMIRDHTTSSANLAKAAKASNTPVDKSLDAEHRAKIEKLRGLSGAAFDKAYLNEQQMGHEKALATLKDYAATGTVAPLKTFAADTSTVVAMHYDHVKKLNAAK